MAKGEKRVRVRITGGVIFEGKDLFPGETQVLPDWFAQSLYQSNRGVDADEAEEGDGEDEGEGKGGGEKPAAQTPASEPRQPARPRG